MKVIAMRILVLLFTVLCASCSSTLPSLKPYHLDVQQGNVVTSKMMLQLKPGMSKSQVRYLMGTPLLQDSFHQDRWDYLYQMNKGGDVIERRRVILEFKEDGLVAVRGDVIAAGSPGAETAPMANISDVKTARSDKTLLAEDAKASWLDRFKFWKDEEKSVVPIVTAKPIEVAKIDAPKPTVAKVEAPVSVVVPVVVAPAAQAAEPLVNVVVEPAPPALNQSTVQSVSTEPEPVDLKAEVATVLTDWANAWRAKDIKNYLKFYSDKFVPEGMSRSTWVAQRKQKIAGQAGKITLTLDKVTINAYPTKSRVGFVQHYSNGKFSDDVVKVLSFERENNRWLIVSESVVNKPAKSDPKDEASAKVEASDKLAAPKASLSNEDVKPRDVTIDEKSEAMPAQIVQEAAKPLSEPITVETLPKEVTRELQPVVNAPSPAKAEPAKLEPAKTEAKSETSKVESSKDKALPPEGSPGYFERMLEKIGF